MAWAELDALDAKAATSFRLSLAKEAPRRTHIDPRLSDFCALATLDLCEVGLRRLDDVELQLEDGPGSVVSVDGHGEGVSTAVGLRRMTRLRDLLLSNNVLGPVLLPDGALHGLVALRSLDLQGNGLEVLPAALVSLTALTSLNIGRNRLTELPWLSLSLLPELRLLAAPHNQLTRVANSLEDGPSEERGSAALEASLPPRLAELTLRANQLTGDGGIAALAQLGGLVALDVADNQLTSLPAELAVSCARLARLDISGNSWADKKLLKLAEAQEDRAPAKPILELLRKGQSRRQLKAEQGMSQQALPPPPRLYLPRGAAAPDEPPSPPPAPKKSGKKGRGGADAAAAVAAIASPSKGAPPRKCVAVSRDALSVRPHILMALLHVVVDDEKENASRPPFFFYAEGHQGCSPSTFDDAFEANLGLLERGLSFDNAADVDNVSKATQLAATRLQAFVTAQTRIHTAGDLGDKRRAGALGTHNAATVTWPLRFDALPHARVQFAPLAIGWMQSKGVTSAADFASEAAAGRVAGAAKDVAAALQQPAKALLASPLCPHVVDAQGVVLSVHPLSNGWETRTTADARGAVLLECSSSKSEMVCRRMLLALICEAIDLVEGGEGGAADEELRKLRRERHVRVLVEPVDVVCDWDPKLRRAEFPSHEELLSLPPLPEGCSEGQAPRTSGGQLRGGLGGASDSGDVSD